MNLSLIVPVYNEEENLPLLYSAVDQALNPLNNTWEVIFVDDGSKDGSFDVLQSLVEKDPEHVRVLSFRCNFGQTAAITAGIDHACGEIIVLLDADMQNEPGDIPMLLAKLDEGYDLVSGWRKDRKDNRLTRTIPIQISLNEGLDIGEDAGSPVDFTYKLPYKFTGKIEKVTVELK